MKKLLLISLAAAGVLYAGIVDGVAVTVNGKVVTMYEIVKLSEQNKISRQEALEALVEKKLEEAELSKQDIKVDDFDVQKKIEQIAAANNLSMSDFRSALASRGIDFDEYKKDIKNKMAKEKLLQKITYQKFSPVDEKDAKLFFENNKQQFSAPAKIDAIQYSSKDKNALERLAMSPMSNEPSVEKEEIAIDVKSLDSSLAYVFKNTKEGSFTQIMPVKDKFVAYYVKDKKEFGIPDFDSVKSEVLEKMGAQKDESTIKDYFEKLKASAKIKVIRLPN